MFNDHRDENSDLFYEQDLTQVFHVFQKENIGQIFDIFQEQNIGQIIDIIQDQELGQTIDIFQDQNIGEIFDVFQEHEIGQVMNVCQKLNMERAETVKRHVGVVHESEQEFVQVADEVHEPEQELMQTADEKEEEIDDAEEEENEEDVWESNTDKEENDDEDQYDDNTDNEEEEEENDDGEQDFDEETLEISEKHDQLLQQFHDWLSLMENETETSSDETEPKIGLYQLYEALIAQRQELKLYTKSGRHLQELLQQSVDEMSKTTNALNQLRQEQLETEQKNAKPFLSSIMEIDESIQRTSAALDSLRIRINTFIRDRLEILTEEYYHQLSWWERFRKRKTIQNFVDYVIGEQTNDISQIFNAFQQGFAILVQRMDRVLKKHALERINPVGKPVDPETMQVTAVVETQSVPEGSVVDVLRFGYLWQGQIIRFADVRAAVKSERL